MVPKVQSTVNLSRIVRAAGCFGIRELISLGKVKVDRAMHEEVLERIEPLNIAPYKGFIQPRLVAIEQDGEIVDVKIEPMENFVAWMLESEDKYSFLPLAN